MGDALRPEERPESRAALQHQACRCSWPACWRKTLVPPAPKKGVISDLDDTLWKGIVGDEGPENVHWDLHGDAQMHGLYQKLLGSLSENGTLVGVASKNDPAVVAKTFERSDMILRPEQVFPIEASWNAKSGAVKRILETWNIAADSVIFVDDSPMELAEVAAQHPGIECVLFPKEDPVAALQMLRRLRDLCGKDKVSSDDLLRLASIRQGAAFRQQAEGGSAPESFLEQAQAVVTFDFSAAAEPRTLELVNKTNQFNLNGRRWAEADWHKEAGKRPLADRHRQLRRQVRAAGNHCGCEGEVSGRAPAGGYLGDELPRLLSPHRAPDAALAVRDRRGR